MGCSKKHPSNIRKALLYSREALASGKICPVLTGVLENKFPEEFGKGYLLHHMPDQSGDLYWVLINKDTIAIIEIPWPHLKTITSPATELMDAEDYIASLTSNGRTMARTAKRLITRLYHETGHGDDSFSSRQAASGRRNEKQQNKIRMDWRHSLQIPIHVHPR